MKSLDLYYAVFLVIFFILGIIAKIPTRELLAYLIVFSVIIYLSYEYLKKQK